MIDALRDLGADIRATPDGYLSVWGVGGRWRTPAEGVTLEVGGAGTAARFLAAAAIHATRPVTLDGDARMRERSIAELGGALGSFGCGVAYMGNEGSLPVRITPPATLPSGHTITLPKAPSSQFLSGLLMAGLFCKGGATIKTLGHVASPSYARMTLALLSHLGASVRDSEDLRVVRVRGVSREGHGLASFDYTVEPDASGATTLWTAAALLPGRTCKIEGLSLLSVQGDAKYPQLLARMGVTTTHARSSAEGGIAATFSGTPTPVIADMTDMPDAAMNLAVFASFAPRTSTLTGLTTLRGKESDRIAALTKELAKVGVRCVCPWQNDPGAMTITPPADGLDLSPSAPPVVFETHNDHRLAMALALIGLRRPNCSIANPGCVAKSYPAFWSDLASLLG
jgi:3-phosphoshikimate 1-carboxyvinyltransferase